MKTLRFLLLFLLTFVGVGAHAQRTLVPIVNFENVPVADVAGARFTSEDVKNAFVSGGDAAGWQLVPLGDGLIEGSFVKDGKHTVVVTIRYDAEKYSVLFKSSKNMNQRANNFQQGLSQRDRERMTMTMDESPAAAAERKQRALFANRRESSYITRDPESVIHPSYELWVHELLDRVHVKLKRPS